MRQFLLKYLVVASVLTTLLGASFSAAADCPAPQHIQRYQLGSQGYYWADDAEGWTGFTQGTDHNDTALTQFNHAVWWDYHDKTPTAFCFYIGNKGSLVEMSEGDWNRLVKQPLGQAGWSPSIFKGYPAESCWADIKTCGFSYY